MPPASKRPRGAFQRRRARASCGARQRPDICAREGHGHTGPRTRLPTFRSVMQNDQIWREQRRSIATAGSEGGGACTCVAAIDATAGNGAANITSETLNTAQPHKAEAAKAPWLAGATSALGAHGCAEHDCVGRGPLGAGHRGVQHAIASFAANAAPTARHPTPPAAPARISASTMTAKRRIELGRQPLPCLRVAAARRSGNSGRRGTFALFCPAPGL